MTDRVAERYRLLWIDDHAADVQWLRDALQLLGERIDLVVLTSPPQAVIWLQFGKPVDLLVADLRSHPGDDLQLILRACACNPGPAVPAILTGGSFGQAPHASDRPGLDLPFFVKPSTWLGYVRLAREIFIAFDACSRYPGIDVARMLSATMLRSD